MKKLGLLLLVMILWSVGMATNYQNLCDFEVDGTYYLFLPNTTTPLVTDCSQASSLLQNTKNISAECIKTTYTQQTMQDLSTFLSYTIIAQEHIDQLHIIYAYSPYLKGNIVMHGQKANLQLAIAEDVLWIGYPILYGGY